MKAPSKSLLALVPDAFGGRGGIAQYNRDFLSALLDAGAISEITIIPRQAPDPVVLPHGIAQTAACPTRTTYARSVMRTVLSRRFDIVFCGHLFMVSLAAATAKLADARFVVQAHGIEAWRCPSRSRRLALESADLVMCVSRYTRSAVLQWGDIAPERVVVLPNTVRACFTPGPVMSDDIAAQVRSRRVLLSVGLMDTRYPYKGQDRVIQAIPRIVAAGHDVIYLIAGGGDDRARLKALAVAVGVDDRVRFLGPIGLDSLIDAYRLADLFVMPSTGEGFGIAFVEAMASGTRALGLNLAGAMDALADGELGAVVSEGDLASGIIRLLSAEKPDRIALAAATRARFGRDRFVAAAAGAIHRLLEAA